MMAFSGCECVVTVKVDIAGVHLVVMSARLRRASQAVFETQTRRVGPEVTLDDHVAPRHEHPLYLPMFAFNLHSTMYKH